MVKTWLILVLWCVNGSSFTVALNSTTTLSPTTIAVVIVQGPSVPISRLLQQSTICTKFNSLWINSQVLSALLKDSTYTLFVPTDAAWDRLHAADQALINSCLSGTCGTQLQTLIRYHMWLASASTRTFPSGASGACSSPFGTDANTQRCFTWSNYAGGSSGHVALNQVGSSWYVNGARIVIPDQQAQNFVVHFIEKWLFPIDTTSTASAYLSTATSGTGVSSLISQTCTMCSPVFADLWSAVTNGAIIELYTWSSRTVSTARSGITMFVPALLPANQYSISAMANYINSLKNSQAGLNSLSKSAVAHVIPNRVLFLDVWIASGAGSQSCGPSNEQTMPQFIHTCDLTQLNASTWSVEVGRTAATILYADIPVENGVMHIISNPLELVYGSLWDMVQVHPLLRSFREHLQSDPSGAALAFLKSTNQQYTVFAADDASWNAANEALSGSNSSAKASLLLLGIVPGVITLGAIQSQMTILNPVVWSTPGVSGNKLRFTHGLSGMQVDGGFPSGFVPSIVTQPGVGATNGILHIVSGDIFGVSQLSIAQFLLSRSDLEDTAFLLGQLTEAWSILDHDSGPYTVIAPTNTAWAALASSAQLSKIADESVLIRNVMLRHYMPGDAQLYDSLTNSGSSFSVTTMNGVVTFTALSISPPQFQVSYGTIVLANVNASDYVCTNGRVHIINSVLAVHSDTANYEMYCQNPHTCAAMAIFGNASLLLFAVLLNFWTQF